MKPEAVLILILGLGALAIVLLNDWWTKRFVKSSAVNKSTKKPETKKMYYIRVTALATVIIIYALVLNSPNLMEQLRQGDYGIIDPIVKHFLRSAP